MDYRQVVIDLEKHGIEIFKQVNYDKDGNYYHGTNYYLKDRIGFLHRTGEYHEQPTNKALDFSGNGTNITDFDIEETMKEVERFYILQDIKDCRSFTNYIESVAKPLEN